MKLTERKLNEVEKKIMLCTLSRERDCKEYRIIANTTVQKLNMIKSRTLTN